MQSTTHVAANWQLLHVVAKISSPDPINPLAALILVLLLLLAVVII